MLVIVIGYHETTGQAIDGDVFTAENDRDACRQILDLRATDVIANEDVGGWRAFEYKDGWGPGREINPIDTDYLPEAKPHA